MHFPSDILKPNDLSTCRRFSRR